MFGVDTSELLIIAVVALLFIGPKELPQTLRTVGRWVGKVRAYSRHFTSGIENVIREAELEEMERKWREENERILREYPALESLIVQDEQPLDGDTASELPVTAASSSDPAEQKDVPMDRRELP